MSEILELQTEEREALLSIYEGDASFKECDATTYQYKYGEDNHKKSFLVEVKWGEHYPNELPTINMDTFYNQHLIADVKQKIADKLLNEGNQWLGCGMTYTLFECLKDNLEELIAEQPETSTAKTIDLTNGIAALKISDNTDVPKEKDGKKEQLTKAQKRRQWERTDHKGERARGWNWVDIVKHLSQTGSKEQRDSSLDVTTTLEHVIPHNI